jgi:hypothetical protein
MDTIRSAEVRPAPAAGSEAGVLTASTGLPPTAAPQPTKLAMFTNIAVGDAP